MTDNAGTIAAFLKSKGLTVAQIAGVLGNFKVESGLSPTAYNPREKAIGLAQWENGRRTALQAYARAHGGKETDLGMQLGYLWSELTGKESGALTALRQTTTPGQAAAVWDAKFERSSGEARGARVAAAENFAAHGWSGGDSSVLSKIGKGAEIAGGLVNPLIGATAAAGALGSAGGVSGLAGDAAGALGIPSTDQIGATATKAGVYLLAFGLGGTLVVLGLNKAAGNPAGKVAGAATHLI